VYNKGHNTGGVWGAVETLKYCAKCKQLSVSRQRPQLGRTHTRADKCNYSLLSQASMEQRETILENQNVQASLRNCQQQQQEVKVKK
jgi:hypothetical protein